MGLDFVCAHDLSHAHVQVAIMIVLLALWPRPTTVVQPIQSPVRIPVSLLIINILHPQFHACNYGL